jgi:two-component system, sensor histidine kinase PdtaS
MIHERLHNDDDAGSIDLREYTEALSAALLEVYGSDRITLLLELQPVIVSLAQANPCALILNELLTNSLKHAFPGDRAGEIRIALSSKDDLITLTVADNGVGVGATKNDSMGLRIVDILTRQLDAELKQDSESGASFTLTFRRLVKPAAKRAAS